MRVDIYITSQFTGRVTRGHGVYGIVLVTEINGKNMRKLIWQDGMIFHTKN